MSRIDLKRAFFFFLMCFFMGTLYLAGTRSLCETLEAESALIAKAYVQGKAFLINNLAGNEDLDKPPFYYWLMAGLSFLSPNWEMAARLPSVLALCLFLVLFYKVAWRMKRPKAFFVLWSLIFLFCPKVLWMGQVARMDLLFSASCFLALFFFMKAVGLVRPQEQAHKDYAINKRYLAPFFASAALSVMIKGPVGAIIVFSPIVVFLLLERRLGILTGLFISPYFLLFLMICLPWYIFVTLKTDFRFFHRFILEENLSRFTSLLPGDGFKEFNHSPVTRYLVYFATGFFPWSLLVPWWMVHLPRKWRRLEPSTRFFFIYFVFVFLFFSVAQSKRSDYILPLYPAAAYICADLLLREKAAWLKPLFYLLAALVASLSALAAIFGLLEYVSDLHFLLSIYFDLKSQSIVAFFMDILKEQAFLYLFLCFFTLFILTKGKSFFSSRSQEPGNLPCFLTFVGVLVLVINLFVLPAIYRGKDARPFCRKVERIASGFPLYFGGFWDEECAFYIKRKIPRIDINKAYSLMTDKNERVFFILDGKRYRRLLEKSFSFPFEYRDKALVLRTLILVSNLPLQFQEAPAK